MRFFYCCVSVRPNNGSQVWHVYVVAGCRSTGHIVESELLWVAFYGSRRQFIIRFSLHITLLISLWWAGGYAEATQLLLLGTGTQY